MQPLPRRHWMLGVVAMISMLAASQAQAQAPARASEQPAVDQAATAPSSAALVSDPEYRLGDGDIVEIAVIGTNDFNTRSRVSTDGAVVLPLLGPIPARGDTPSELATRIGAALKKGGYFASPVVRVELIGIRSRYVIVLGNVSTPGLVPLDRSYRLSELMARVGGSGGGAGASYVILTPTTGASVRYSLAALATGSASEDPVVQAGDKVYVPPASAELFYMTGAVAKPGPMSLMPNMTVRLALAVAGGVAENGSEKKFTVVRNGAKLPAANLDTKLEAGDIVTFGTRMF